MAISKFTLVEVVASSNGKPTVQAWTAASEQPGLSDSHKVLGVTMTDSEYEQPVAVMKRGYLRGVVNPGGEAPSWSVGDILWAQEDGSIDNVRLAAPYPQIVVGTMFADEGGGLCTVDVDVRVLPSLGELSGVKMETPADLDVFIYDSVAGVWEPRQLDHGADIAGLTDALDHPMLQRKHGFEVASDGSALVTISYSPSTRIVTVTPTGSTFKFWIDGVGFEKTGAQAAPAHAASIGKHYIYYDATGTLQQSTSAWAICDRTVTPVALVYYYNATVAICFFECHTADRWLEGHYNLHFTQGTKIVSGFALTGYTLDTGSDAAVTFAIASGVIADEDIARTLSAVPDAGPYTVMYRTGAAGDWTYITTPVLPFAYGATYPQWNKLTGGSWQLTELVGTGSGTWVNYYLVGVPSVSAGTQLILIPGQTTYASLAAAQGATISEISWGTIPFEEVAPLYRLTYNAKSSWGGSRKAKLVSVTAITAGGASITQVSSPSVHNSLSNRDAANAHPAASITFTPYVGTALNLAATDVQAAIQEIADEVATSIDTLDEIGDVNAPTPAQGDVLSWDDVNGEWVATAPGAANLDLDDVTDVNAPTPNDGDVLTWDNANSEWIAAPGAAAINALDDIGDVNAPAPNNGDVLAWDSTPGEWVPVSPSTPGSHASSHEAGGLDELEIANLATAETDTDLVLKPDGTGGVAWGAGGGGGGTVHHQARFASFSPISGTYPLMEMSASVSVVKVRAFHVGSGSLSVNVIKNARGTPSDILASDLTSSASSWQNAAASGGSVALVAGDELDVELIDVTGFVENVVVIVDYEEAL